MSSLLPTRTDVLIVGAGPVGLALAVSLARLGVDHVLIERNEQIAPGSKAAVVQPGTLEYLDRAGLAEDLIAAGRRGQGFHFRVGSRMLFRASFDELDTPFPFPLVITQDRTEERLEHGLRALGGAAYRGTTLLHLRPDFPGMIATVATADGSVRAVSARYVVGCDGVRSKVRELTGISFAGDSHEPLFALADVRLSDPGEDYTDTTYFLSTSGMAIVSPLQSGLHRIVAAVPPDSTPPTAEGLESILAATGAKRVRVTEVAASSTYRVQERMADRYIQGPVFLVGDAAHTHSPAGAQGMNTGIQDAGNLAWKLHAVLTGAASERLLDSYETERRPVASAVIAFTRQLAAAATLRDPELVRLRNMLLAAAGRTAEAPAWLARRLAQLDVGYARTGADGPFPVGARVSPLLVAPSGLDWVLAVPPKNAENVPESGPGGAAVQVVDQLTEPLLVRPDGYVAAYGDISALSPLGALS